MFTPYHIHCVTCNATLKVGREEIIGEILTCPQCHSMVKVEADAPNGNSAGNNMETTSNTTADSQRANGTAGLLPPIQAPPLPEEKAASNSPPTELPIPRLPTAPKTVWPPWLLLTTAAIGGAMFMGFIWTFLKGGFTSHLPQQANTVNVTTPDVSKHLAQNTETVDGTAIQKVHTKEVKPYDKVADPLPNSNSDIPQAEPEPETPPVVHATRSKTPTLQSEHHPVGPGRQISSPLSEESDRIKPPAKEDSNQSVTTEANLERTQHIPLPDPSPEIAARLDLEIERIHFEDTTLGNVIDLIAQLTGISINIDDEALLDRRLSRNSRIQFTAERGRVADVLASLLKQEGLAFVATGNEIIITGAKPGQ